MVFAQGLCAYVILISLHITKQDIIGVRLRGGYKVGQGKVEVKRRDQWGAICDDNWTIREANVVCRQLGYAGAAAVLKKSWYGEARGPIWVRKLTCSGLEKQLADCTYQELPTPRKEWYENVDEKNFCSYARQAAVRCKESPQQEIGLINLGRPQVSAGASRRRSRLVKVWHNSGFRTICADTWTTKEAIVACRQANQGYATLVEKIRLKRRKRTVVNKLACKGNESSLHECRFTVKYQDCAEYASVFCTHNAPDINVNITYLQNSIKIVRKLEKDMVCAREEECISSSGYNKSNEELANSDFTRRLLAFTSLVQNFGNADFLPPKVVGGWYYHTCHKHYHSMEDFATYELRDSNSKLIEVGHKVSFCLRDNICVDRRRKKYTCSVDYKVMYQGISIGCGDLYSNTLDCQWIDVTDVPDGVYYLEIHSNPHLLVAEQDYTNNFVRCKVTISGVYAFGEECHWPYDFDEILHRDGFLI